VSGDEQPGTMPLPLSAIQLPYPLLVIGAIALAPGLRVPNRPFLVSFPAASPYVIDGQGWCDTCQHPARRGPPMPVEALTALQACWRPESHLPRSPAHPSNR